MYHKKVTCVKLKNDVDNSVDNVENVMWYCAFSDTSSVKINKKSSVILSIMSKSIKKILIYRKYIDIILWNIIYCRHKDIIWYIIL